MKNKSHILFFVLIPFSFSCHRVEPRFHSEVDAFMKTLPADRAIQQEPQGLPAPVVRHIHACGFIGKPSVTAFEVIWAESYIRMKPGQLWMKLQTRQINGSRPPFRIAYMKAYLLKMIPFEGRDLLYEKGASMWGRIGGVKDIFDVSGPELTQSAMITWLAEVLLMPGVIADSMLTWHPVNDSMADVSLDYQGFRVSGRFFFDKEGRAWKFESADRYFSKPDGSFEKIPWTAIFTDYQTGPDGFMIPTNVSAIWHLPEGDYEYWEGRIAQIKPLVGN